MGRKKFSTLHDFVRSAKQGGSLTDLASSEGLTPRQAVIRLQTYLHNQPQARVHEESRAPSTRGRPSGRNPGSLTLLEGEVEYYRLQLDNPALPKKKSIKEFLAEYRAVHSS